jgi:crossover junction endodeoxyribonuclease RuvC
MLIVGVDPGSIRTGYGAILTDGRRHELLESGALVPPQNLELALRLRHIHEGLRDLIARLRPDALAVEDLFHAKSARSAIVLGHVRGVALLAGAEAGIRVLSYPPATVKAQVSGEGRAQKHQVALMVGHLLRLARGMDPGDAADALAVALCAALLEAGPAAEIRAEAVAASKRR